MTFSSGLKSPQNDASFPTYNSSMRPSASQMSSAPSTASGERASLHRRFTTNALPTLPTLSSLNPLSPIGQQRKQAAESSSELAAIQKVQLLQKRREDYAHLREQRKRFQTEIELIDLHAKAEEHELQRLEQDLHRSSLPGHQSEPTTPPEYRENNFPSAISRPNRLSMHSLSSAQGVGSIASPRTIRSGSHTYNTAFNMNPNTTQIPSSSMPGSRRGSDEEEETYRYTLPDMNRRPPGANLNRNSMPVTNFDLRNMPDVNSVLGINNIDALVGEDDDDDVVARSIDGMSLLHMDTTSEGFPILGRRVGDMQQSSTSSALDLIGMPAAAEEAQSNGWPSAFARHRPNQSMSSLPMNALRNNHGDDHEMYQGNTYGNGKKSNRYSLDAHSTYAALPESKRSSFHAAINGISSAMPKLQSSYSTNDIPTVKNTNGLTDVATAASGNLTHAEQHLHKHNATLGRIPINASNRHSRDMSTAESRAEEMAGRPMSSALQANATSFGPTTTGSAAAAHNFTSPSATPSNMNTNFSQSGYYGGFGTHGMSNGGPVNGMANGVSMLNMGMNNMSINGPNSQWSNQMQMYSVPYGGGYSHGFQSYGNSRPNQQDSQARVMAMRRNQNNEDNARFANYKLENMHGQIYDLCKDQHGCRFLQRKLEEHDPEHVQMIFEETKDHVVELMIDPFGNYLCQKMLEFSTDEQRTTLISNAARDMVQIALNQHGTRALQKMIEFITTKEQIEIVKGAFCNDVVALIQDLNGNHVIQKCLNHLRPDDADFIFTAVAANCLTVGTHRHGCCVLQRCIDHAIGDQKHSLVHAVISNAYPLVQDPFGNYVVQYILDLNNPAYTRPLCQGFRGRTVELSKQKFSSNVIEKCLRVSDIDTNRQLIEEFVRAAPEMEKLLRDHFANYVVQTALEHGDPEMKNRLWDIIIPIIPSMRSTPCGRRLISKLQQRDTVEGGDAGAQFTPESSTTPAITPQRQLSSQPYSSPSHGINGMNALTGMNSMNSFGNAYTSNAHVSSPPPHRLSIATAPVHLQNIANQYSQTSRGQIQGHGNGNGHRQAHSSPQQGRVKAPAHASSQQVQNGVQNFGSPQHAQMNGQAFGSPQHAQANGQTFAPPQHNRVNGQGYASPQQVHGQGNGGLIGGYQQGSFF